MSTLTRPITEREPDTMPDRAAQVEDRHDDLHFEFPELGTAGFLPRLEPEPEPDVS